MTSLIADLESIDLGPIEGALATIRGAAANPDVQRLLGGDAFTVALGSLGSAVDSLRGADASALLRPVVDAAAGLHIDTDSLPLAEYISAVSEAAEMIVRLLELMQDPASLARNIPFDRLLESARSLTSGFSVRGGGDAIAGLRALIGRAEEGLGGDPRALATFAVDALMPFGGGRLLDIRGRLDGILTGSASIALPGGRMAGLLLALDAVAAAAGNPQQLARALADLDRIRRSTLEVLRDDLRQIRETFATLHVAETLDTIISAAGVIKSGERGVLELFDSLREGLAAARQQVQDFDAAQLRQFLDSTFDSVEELARQYIEKPIDDQIAQTEAFVRGVFSGLPHHRIRAQISEFLASVAEAIRDLELDRVAREANALVDRIEAALDPAALTAEIQAVLAEVRAVADNLLGGVTTALDTVVSTMETIETQLQAVLDRVVQVLTTFSAAMTEITRAIETLGIEEATDQVVATIRSLRETAEQLLSAAPLPEAMRPAVEQLISTLESIDYEIIFRPVDAVVGQLRIPAEVKDQITNALEQVAEKLENAIPAQLIASIRTEIAVALNTIRGFNPAGLLDGVSGYLDEAADFIESLDPVEAARQIRGPFQTVLDAIDSAHPRLLLAPVIEGYNSIFARISPPSVEGVFGALTSAINTAGAGLAQQIVSPVGQLTGAPVDVTPPVVGGAAPGASSAPPPEPAPNSVRPGDVIRFFGWLPNKLREALQALPSTAVGETMATIDSITSGMARDLRVLRVRLLEVQRRIESQLEGELRLVADAQIRAQLALQVSAPGVDVSVSMNALAAVSPSDMLRELASILEELRGTTRDAADSMGGNAAVALDRAATALETFALARIVGDADAFLAALDPEPLAAEVDALVVAVLEKAPALMEEAEADIRAAINRVPALVTELNPAAQAQKFLRVLDLVREELKVLDPGVLAEELGAIHAAIREAVAAYDPVLLAANVREALLNVAGSLRALDPAALLGDIDIFGPIVARIEDADPAAVLEGIGTGLASVGEQLVALDPRALLEAIEQLLPRITAAFRTAIDAITEEVIALLQSIRYAAANASASASVSAG